MCTGSDLSFFISGAHSVQHMEDHFESEDADGLKSATMIFTVNSL